MLGARAKANTDVGDRRETAKFKTSAESAQVPRFTSDQMIAVSALTGNNSQIDQESVLTETEVRERDIRQENTMLKDQLASLKQDLMVH